MRTLAANLDLRGRAALLIGAGAVGRRKLSHLLESGALITAVEPNPSEWLLELHEKAQLKLEAEFSPELLDNSPLVFIASDPAPFRELAALIKDRGLWVNIAGEPELGNFTLPALAEDGPFRLAVSTGGASPALSASVARRLRADIKGLGALCRALKALRPIILTAEADEKARRRIFSALAENSELLEHLSEGRLREALELVKKLIEPAALPPDFSPELLSIENL